MVLLRINSICNCFLVFEKNKSGQMLHGDIDNSSGFIDLVSLRMY